MEQVWSGGGIIEEIRGQFCIFIVGSCRACCMRLIDEARKLGVQEWTMI